MEKRGIFTISIDLELAWGICDRPLGPHEIAALEREREIMRRLLALFEEYDIRATWAVVGHLLLSEAPWDGEKAHPDFPRPVLQDETRDWFFQLSNTPDDPAWFGRDLVEKLKNAEPAQDIGSHSFCHLPYDETRTSRAAIEADVETARNIHANEGLPFETFIFPRNCVGYKEVLARAGIRVYRGRTPRWYHRFPRTVNRMLNLLTFALGIPPKPVKARIDELGLVNVPDSMLFLGRDGIRRFISSRSLRRMATKGLDRAVQQGKIFHLWFHPSNFAHQMDEQFALLENILAYASRLRDQQKLATVPMSEIGNHILTSR
jgi:peptidoglycan/xylan/chitin deacetylase (PgdA/CDA1 family)